MRTKEEIEREEISKEINKLRNKAIKKYGIETRNKKEQLDCKICFLEGKLKGLQEKN